MADSRTFRLRVVYVKKNRLALLSHLEVIHALERCVRRAALPFAVTQGFSPHMKIAFGSALPVGVGGVNEIFDIYLTNYIPLKEALSVLQEASVDDLKVVSCSYVEPKAPAASIAFPVSDYQAVFDAPLSEVCLPQTITVSKKGKDKVLKVADYLCAKPVLDGCRLSFSLMQTQNGSLRADAFLNACLALQEQPPQLLSLTRIAQREG